MEPRLPEMGDVFELRIRLRAIEPEIWRRLLVPAVTVERVSADGDGGFTCSGGARSCPPEDCGGTHGYANLLEILNDPSHPEHRETKTWAGRRFDPERFDVAAVNRKLGTLAKRLRRLEEK